MRYLSVPSKSQTKNRTIRGILPQLRGPDYPGRRLPRFSRSAGLFRVYALLRRQGGRVLRPPILRDFPEVFETGRLLIRSPMPGDGPELHAAVRESMDELLPWMPWPKEHGTVDDSEASARAARVRFLERADLRMHLYLKETGTLVGSSGLHCIDWEVPKFEIGYWCRTRLLGQGYTTEAVRGIAAFAFDALGAKRVEIRCDALNRPSARVAERAGFHLEGELRNDVLGKDGTPRNTLVFSAIPPGPDGPRP